MTHTKGPWVVQSGAVYTASGAPIANMVRDESATLAGIDPVERDRNAHLIAAAPELLAALESLEEEASLCDHNTALNAAILKARKIIQKAKGI